jgi:hypothetical protein
MKTIALTLFAAALGFGQSSTPAATTPATTPAPKAAPKAGTTLQAVARPKGESAVPNAVHPCRRDPG